MSNYESKFGPAVEQLIRESREKRLQNTEAAVRQKFADLQAQREEDGTLYNFCRAIEGIYASTSLINRLAMELIGHSPEDHEQKAQLEWTFSRISCNEECDWPKAGED